MISGGESPRESDIGPRANDHTTTEFSAEETKQGIPEERGPRKRIDKKNALTQNPQGFLEPAGAPVKIRIVIKIQSHLKESPFNWEKSDIELIAGKSLKAIIPFCHEFVTLILSSDF